MKKLKISNLVISHNQLQQRIIPTSQTNIVHEFICPLYECFPNQIITEILSMMKKLKISNLVISHNQLQQRIIPTSQTNIVHEFICPLYECFPNQIITEILYQTNYNYFIKTYSQSLTKLKCYQKSFGQKHTPRNSNRQKTPRFYKTNQRKQTNKQKKTLSTW